MASDSGASHYFKFLICCRLVLNMIPFPVSTAKLAGNFYNKRSAANRCPSFAYSFVSFMLHQYYWCCFLYSTSRRNGANKKNSAKTSNCCCNFAVLGLLAFQRRPASPFSTGSNVAPIKVLHIQCQYSWQYVAYSTSPICPQLTYTLGSSDWTQKYSKNKMKTN